MRRRKHHPRPPRYWRYFGPDPGFRELKGMWILEKYQEAFEAADEDVMAQFQYFSRQFKVAYWIGIVLSIAFLAVAGSLFFLFVHFLLSDNPSRFQKYASVGAGLVAILMISYYYYRNPVTSLRYSAADLLKLGVIYLGYVRQINQIDIAFGQAISKMDRHQLQDLEETMRQVREAVDQTVDDVSRALEDLNGFRQ
jgi:hypothetical protein